MPYEFTKYEPNPETQASASRSMGPPRKGIGIGVLDGPGEAPVPGTFRWPRISLWAGILLLLLSLAALFAASLLRH
jgi:hypothetical protein